MKPSDIFIGVTDFFSVLLPGSLLTWFCHCYSYQTCLELKLPVCLPEERSEQIALFLAVAYIVGNLLFIAASQLDDLFYDKFRNWAFNKNKDLPFQTAKFIRNKYINAPKLIDDLIANKYIKLENHDEKLSGKEILNTYKWALCFIGAEKPDLLVDVKKYEADSKFFRSLVVGFIIVAFTILLKENNGILFVGLVILSFLSFYRYADLRHKSTEKAYQIIITLHHLKAPKSGN